MVFALDNAECAAEVVEILTDALTLKETPIPTKVRISRAIFWWSMQLDRVSYANQQERVAAAALGLT